MYTPKGEINEVLLNALNKEGVMAKVADCKSIEAAYDVVKEAVPEITMDEFKEGLTIMKAYYEESEDGALSEEDLDQVAGGKTLGDIEKGFDKVADVVKKYSPISVILSFL